MGIVGISEFTFGFAFLYEQTTANWGDVKAAPVLPSLQQEQAVGWDAHLPLSGVDYYYQFKISDYLYRGNAKYIDDGTYDLPYYRIALHRKNGNRQHQRLRMHCADNPFTYYVAPEFNALEAFNASFLARQVREESRIIPLNECDDILDGAQHYITFQEGRPGFTQHSAAKRHEHSFFGKELPALYRQSSKNWSPIDRGFAERLFDKTHAVVSRTLEREESELTKRAMPLLDFAPQAANRREILIRTSEILSTFLGVTLVLVGSTQ